MPQRTIPTSFMRLLAGCLTDTLYIVSFLYISLLLFSSPSLTISIPSIEKFPRKIERINSKSADFAVRNASSEEETGRAKSEKINICEGCEEFVGLYRMEGGGWVAIGEDHGIQKNGGSRGRWWHEGPHLVLDWNDYEYKKPQVKYTWKGNKWIPTDPSHKPLNDRIPLLPENYEKYTGRASLRIQEPKGKDRPYMIYMGKCCDEHWELTYVEACREGPGCSSSKNLLFDTSNNDLYHPMLKCDVPCVVHHDPLLPIDVMLSGGYVSRDDYLDDINQQRKLANVEQFTEENRPIGASMSLEPHWRMKPRASSKRDMDKVDMIISTNMNADIPVTRFSLLRLETESYDWGNKDMWKMHWSQYMNLKGNEIPQWDSFDKDHIMSVVIGHCNGPLNYPFGYANRLRYIKALATAGLPMYVTGHMRRCGGSMPKKEFWAKDKRTLIRKYKFHLSIENCDETDWVSEKLYQTLMAGVVPVYVGSPNVFEFVPREAMVIAADFENSKSLVDHLKHLASTPTEYEKYRSWRFQKPESRTWGQLNITFEHSTANAICNICRTLRTHSDEKQKGQYKTSWGRYWKYAVKKGETWTLDPKKGWTINGTPLVRRFNNTLIN